MTPESIAAELRSVADKILRSAEPSRSAVSAAIRRVLAAVDGVQASPATKVVVNESWTMADIPNIVSEHKGVAVKQGYYGEYGVEMPADEAAYFQADVGEGAYIFNSWRDASKASEEEEEYVFEDVDPSEYDGSQG